MTRAAPAGLALKGNVSCDCSSRRTLVNVMITLTSIGQRAPPEDEARPIPARHRHPPCYSSSRLIISTAGLRFETSRCEAALPIVEFR